MGGLGGAAFTPAAARVVLGGGGGAGSRNNSPAIPFASSGGTGGGIVMIRTGSLTGAGTITANGGVGVTPENDGGGGGGAGGSIIVSASTSTVNGLTARTDGANGTNANPAGTPGTAERHGPGGGGSGGVIITSNALPPAQTSVLGGVHGTTTTLADPYGSTSGNPGVVLTTTPATIPGSSSGAECIAALSVTKVHHHPGGDQHLGWDDRPVHDHGEQRRERFAGDQPQHLGRPARRVHLRNDCGHRPQRGRNATGHRQPHCR